MDLFEESEDVIIFTGKNEKQNLESFLIKEDISGRLFRKLYKEKSIYINGKFKNRKTLINKGDIISLLMKDEINNIKPEKMKLDIIYEDFDLLILNKKPYVVVHPTKSHDENTLSNGISYYFRENNINKKIRFVNRLDMNTSGILIVAKNSFAHQQMALQFEKDIVEKKYKAIVEGVVKKSEDCIDVSIDTEEGNIKRIVNKNGQESLTKYTVIDRYKNASLLDIQIFTGRAHQIRVHLSHIGHPIIGDTLYNEESTYIDRQALHSYYLKIKTPRRKEYIELLADLPEDMEALIEKLKNK